MEDEIKGTLADLNKAFDQFKEANDASQKKADVVLTEKVDRINAEIARIEQQAKAQHVAALERMNTLADLSGGGTGKGETAEQREHKDAFLNFVRKGTESGLRDLERKAMTVGSDPAGGFLVPATMDSRIVARLTAMSDMRRLALATQISTDALEVLVDNNDVDAAWVGETQTRSETSGNTFKKVRIQANELAANPKVSQMLIDDSVVDIEAFLTGKLAVLFARKEGAAFISGDGVAKPRGIVTYTTAATADASRTWGVVQHIGTGTSGGFGTAPNGSDKLLDAVHALKVEYQANAKWLMNQTTLAEVRKLKDADGNYLYGTAVLANSFLPTCMGFGVEVMADMPAIAASSLSIAFGDFREAYQIVDRVGIRMLRDPYTDKPNVRFYTTKRVGGDVVNFDAFKLVKFV